MTFPVLKGTGFASYVDWKQRKNKMQVEVYVAFSIPGSLTFIRANKKVDITTRPAYNSHVTVDGLSFKVSEPRMGSSLNNGVKLLADELDDAYNSRDPQKAHEFFTKLKRLSWNVLDEDKFISKHKIAVPVAAPVNTTPVLDMSINTQNEQVIPGPAPSVVAENNQIVEPVAEAPTTIVEKVTDAVNSVVEKVKAAVNPGAVTPNTRNLGTVQKNFIAHVKTEVLPVPNSTIKGHMLMSPADYRDTVNALVKRNIIKVENDQITEIYV